MSCTILARHVLALVLFDSGTSLQGNKSKYKTHIEIRDEKAQTDNFHYVDALFYLFAFMIQHNIPYENLNINGISAWKTRHYF